MLSQERMPTLMLFRITNMIELVLTYIPIVFVVALFFLLLEPCEL